MYLGFWSKNVVTGQHRLHGPGEMGKNWAPTWVLRKNFSPVNMVWEILVKNVGICQHHLREPINMREKILVPTWVLCKIFWAVNMVCEILVKNVGICQHHLRGPINMREKFLVPTWLLWKIFGLSTWFAKFWPKMLAYANIICGDPVMWEKIFGCQHDLINFRANVDTVNFVNKYCLNGNFEKCWQFPPPHR